MIVLPLRLITSPRPTLKKNSLPSSPITMPSVSDQKLKSLPRSLTPTPNSWSSAVSVSVPTKSILSTPPSEVLPFLTLPSPIPVQLLSSSSPRSSLFLDKSSIEPTRCEPVSGTSSPRTVGKFEARPLVLSATVTLVLSFLSLPRRLVCPSSTSTSSLSCLSVQPARSTPLRISFPGLISSLCMSPKSLTPLV